MRHATSTELASALRTAGVAGSDASLRRRVEYSSDASNYRVVPAVVAFPSHADDVMAILAVAHEHEVPVTSRGAGTSIAGNAVGTGIVIDFSRHLNRVLSVDPDRREAVVEPGAILDAVTAAATPHGLRFGPDPSTHSRATIGGSLGNNACGSRALRYGRCSDNVVELDVVTGDGVRFAASTLAAAPEAVGAPLRALIDAHRDVIGREFGRFSRQGSGYALEHLLSSDPCHLARFLVGTEGTLATTVGATVRLTEQPAVEALVVVGYADLPAAAEAVPGILPHRPVALEAIDASLVEVVRRRGSAALPPMPTGGCWLFVAVGGDDLAEARSAGDKLAADAGGLGSAILSGPAAAALWRVREDGAGLAGRTLDNRPAWPGWEDAAVPPDRLADYLRDFRSLMDQYLLSGLTYGHFGDGCVHIRIDFPFATEPTTYTGFVTDAARLVASYGGSLSGEHGDGRTRSALLPLMYSPDAIAAMAAVKGVFDPDRSLNPGVVVDPAPVDASLRVPATRPLTAGLGFAYPDDSDDLSTAVHRCVGVGKCRSDLTGSGGVMCPSYLATRDEKDSTRARARVLQDLANGSLVEGFRSDAVAESLDLCLGCKGCARDCPAGVDMATYKAEALYQRYKGRVRPPAHYSLGWLPLWLRLGALAPRLSNALAGAPRLSAIATRLGGIDQRRPLPQLAPTTFRRWFADHVGPGGGRPVVLWVDTFTDHFSPRIGQAAVAVLEDAGYRVSIPGGRVCCGLTWVSTGQLGTARRHLRASLDSLEAPLARGIPVVGLEPSCTALLRHDASRLLPGDARAHKAREGVRTLAELLTDTEGWTPPRMDATSGVAQPHCHQNAVMSWRPDAQLLADSGASITPVGGCCGLAGNFGAERGHYDVSVAVANTALLPAVAAAGRDCTILADGFSCRTQLEHLAGRSSKHLAELLAEHLPT